MRKYRKKVEYLLMIGAPSYKATVKELPKEEEKKGEKFPVVKQDIRLNNRIIDLRVPTNQAIFRL